MNSPSDFAGRVELVLRRQDGRAAAVDLRVARPTAADTMIGRTADAAARLLPMLYSICGMAQGTAARLAIAAARGAVTADGVDAAVLAEGRREHLWRLLLDWPALLGLPREEALLVEAVRRLKHGGFEAWRDAALRAPLARLGAALDGFADAPTPTRFLPVMSATQTLALWPRLDAGFAAAPHCEGRPAETGALARHAPMTSAAAWTDRVSARIAEVFDESQLGRVSAATVAPGVGRAVVETARGTLMHEVALDGECVAAYVVVAPTEWNFHSRGALAATLAGFVAESAEQLRAVAERAVLAFDPCVRCDIEVV